MASKKGRPSLADKSEIPQEHGALRRQALAKQRNQRYRDRKAHRTALCDLNAGQPRGIEVHTDDESVSSTGKANNGNLNDHSCGSQTTISTRTTVPWVVVAPGIHMSRRDYELASTLEGLEDSCEVNPEKIGAASSGNSTTACQGAPRKGAMSHHRKNCASSLSQGRLIESSGADSYDSNTVELLAETAGLNEIPVPEQVAEHVLGALCEHSSDLRVSLPPAGWLNVLVTQARQDLRFLNTLKDYEYVPYEKRDPGLAEAYDVYAEAAVREYCQTHEGAKTRPIYRSAVEWNLPMLDYSRRASSHDPVCKSVFCMCGRGEAKRDRLIVRMAVARSRYWREAMNADTVLTGLTQQFQSESAFAASVREIVQDTADGAQYQEVESRIAALLQHRGPKGDDHYVRDLGAFQHDFRNRSMATLALQLSSDRILPPQGTQVWIACLALRAKSDLPFRKLMRRVAKGTASVDQKLLFAVLNLKVGQTVDHSELCKAQAFLNRCYYRGPTKRRIGVRRL